MKKLFLFPFVALLLTVRPVRAQSTSDWIQILLLDYKKLGDLRGILTDMKNGFAEIKQVYESVKGIAASNFSLHQVFLQALLTVSPPVRNYFKVAEALSAEFQLVNDVRVASSYWRSTGQFTDAELGFIDARYAVILSRSGAYVEELTMIMTDGLLRMSDASRMESIDRIYAHIMDARSGLRTLNDRIGMLVLQRAHETGTIHSLQQLYEILPPVY